MNKRLTPAMKQVLADIHNNRTPQHPEVITALRKRGLVTVGQGGGYTLTLNGQTEHFNNQLKAAK